LIFIVPRSLHELRVPIPGPLPPDDNGAQMQINIAYCV